MSKMNVFTVILVFTFISLMVYDLQVSILTYYGLFEKSISAMEVRMSTLPKAKLKIPESKYEDDPFPGVSAFIAITMAALVTFFKVKSSTRISNNRMDVLPQKQDPSLNEIYLQKKFLTKEKQEKSTKNVETTYNLDDIFLEETEESRSDNSCNCRNDLFEERLEALDEKLKSTEEITQKWSERIRQTEKELDCLRKQIINVKNDGFLEQQNKEVYDRENLFKKIVDEVIKESRNEIKEEAMFEKMYKNEYYRKHLLYDKNNIKQAELDGLNLREKQKDVFLEENNMPFEQFHNLFSEYNYYEKENMLKGLEDFI